MVLCDIVNDAAAAAFDRVVAIDRCSTRWLLERTLLLCRCRQNTFFRTRKRKEIRIALTIILRFIMQSDIVIIQKRVRKYNPVMYISPVFKVVCQTYSVILYLITAPAEYKFLDTVSSLLIHCCVQFLSRQRYKYHLRFKSVQTVFIYVCLYK